VLIGACVRRALITLVEPGLLGGASTERARSALSVGGASPARLLPFGPGLLSRLPAHLVLEPPLAQATGSQGSLLGPKLPPSLPELPRHLRLLEKTAERRVRDTVVRSELPQGLAGRPSPDQFCVGDELTQSRPTLHGEDSSPPLNAP
jgi:hypothetical protein